MSEQGISYYEAQNIAASLSAGEGSGMETTAEERASWRKRAKSHGIRLLNDIDHLLAREAKAREEGEEAVLRFIENGSFLHDDAPPKRFAKEVVAAYRARSKP